MCTLMVTSNLMTLINVAKNKSMKYLLTKTTQKSPEYN